MIKDLQLTLYEFFGYVLPGLPMIAAVGLLLWTFWFPQVVFYLMLPPTVVWVILLILAYFCGHLVQAVANALLKKLYSPDTDPVAAPPEFVSAARTAASRALGTEAGNLSIGQLYGIASEALAQSGKRATTADVFLYREGFYRGLTVSLSALSVAVALRALSPTSLVIAGTMITLSWTHLLLPAIVLALGAVLMYQRYKRFARYRLSQSLIGFLLLCGVPGTSRQPHRRTDGT